jgi:hypothetical protein
MNFQNGSILVSDEIFDEEQFCFKTSTNLTLQTSVYACIRSVDDDIKHQLYPLGKAILDIVKNLFYFILFI